MKIAFASCVCTTAFPEQPVWDEIAAQNPDHLVLLGDSIYMDINPPAHPEDMSVDDFGKHMYNRYAELFAQKRFTALVKKLPRGNVHAIWDDHDFLWNDALGAEARGNPAQAQKVSVSTAFHEAFRAALTNRLDPGSFPAVYSDPVFWNVSQPPLGTPSLELETGVWLHLTDGRSFRTRTWLLAEEDRSILGAVQRDRLAAAINAAPDAVHVIASGSTLSGWQRYGRDLQWLKDTAQTRRMLILSGDVHHNAFQKIPTTGFSLFEATSSGLATRDAVTVGQLQRNFGMLTLDASTVTLKFFHLGQEQIGLAQSFNRLVWR